MTIPESGEISFSDFYVPEPPPTISFGSAVEVGAYANYGQLDFSETAGRFVVIRSQYISGQGSGHARIGTVSGTTANFGTEVEFTADGLTLGAGAVSFNPFNSNQFIVVFRDYGNSYYPTAIVGTVSGTSISFDSESEVVIVASPRTEILVAFDPNNSGKFIVTIEDPGIKTQAVVGTISGTSISFGTAVTFNSGSVGYCQLAFDPNNSGKFVIVFMDVTNSGYGTAVVGTISGTDVSFGTKTVYYSITSSFNCVGFAGSNKFVTVCRNGGNSNKGELCVGTISGTSISFSSVTVFDDSGSAIPGNIVFDPYNAQNNAQLGGASNFILIYRGTYQGAAISGQLIGSTFTLLTPVVYSPSGSIYSNYNWVAYDPNTENRIVITYQPMSGTYENQTTVRVGTLS